MYLPFYGLREEPFGSTPDPRFLFASAAHREALASLHYSIETGRGFFALIAPPGMGKTTLLYQTLEKYHADAGTAFLFNTQCNAHEFLRFLLSEVGIEGETDDVGRMHCRFNEYLVDNARRGRRFILIVDEAQNLSSEVLETVRLLSNLETSRAKLMQIVLAGQPELYATLKRPELAQLLQRVSRISGLKALTAEETRDYIAHRLAVAGRSGGAMFSDEAVAMVAEYSHGVPRLINSICFNALSLGYASEKTQIDVDLVMEAIAHLPYEHGAAGQTAPAPLYSSQALGHSFGSGVSAGFSPRGHSRIVGMPSKPLISHSAEVKAPPLSRHASPVPMPVPMPAAMPMVAKSPTVAPDSFTATAPSLAQLSSDVAQPVRKMRSAESPLPQLSVQRSDPAVRAISSVPNPVSERVASGRIGSSLRKAVPALLVLICCAAAAGYLTVRHRIAKPATRTAQTANAALPSSGGAPNPSWNAPAPGSPAPIPISNGRPADSPANAEKPPAVRVKPVPQTASFEGVRAAAAPRSSDTAANLSNPQAPVGHRKPKPPAANSGDIPDAVSDTDVIVFPQAIQLVEPEYPFIANQTIASGEVVLTANVNESGNPENLKFLEGNEIFKQAALDAASRWKYRPGTYNGRPVGMPVKIHFRFSSSESKSSQDIKRKEETE